MELEHLYSQNNLVGKNTNTLLNKLKTLAPTLSKTTITKSTVVPKPTTVTTVKPVAVVPVAKPTEIKPTASATLSKPVTANTPVILAANVPGGLKVAQPSPVTTAAAAITQKPVTATVSTPKISLTTTAGINEAIKKAVTSTAPQKTAPPAMQAEIDKNQQEFKDKQIAIAQQKAAELDNTKQASFTLPNMWIMIAMVVGVIVMVVISKRKK